MTTSTKDPLTPEKARHYIGTFREHTLPGADYADFPSGRIHFDDMTDDQAVKVARALMDIEAEAGKGVRRQ
jgi:hypothetical protein